ncbi:hypothetical protein [Chitinibacter tainanensis]|uniref:hypothetical protein n=1 Tax=Chitinibacter tainanensis TaxID=230667 RepID=UPI000405EAAB|nr:hypothetical protein [Chitinibacter tainanensis]
MNENAHLVDLSIAVGDHPVTLQVAGDLFAICESVSDLFVTRYRNEDGGLSKIEMNDLPDDLFVQSDDQAIFWLIKQIELPADCSVGLSTGAEAMTMKLHIQLKPAVSDREEPEIEIGLYELTPFMNHKEKRYEYQTSEWYFGSVKEFDPRPKEAESFGEIRNFRFSSQSAVTDTGYATW